MMTTAAARARGRLHWALGAAVGMALLVTAYAAWVGYLAVMASEGAVPPRSRVPDVPSGARVVSETTECASGGCWRQLLLRPGAGQSPEELAAEMGVAEEKRHPFRALDPHAVTVGSRVAGDRLSIYVQY